MPGEHLTAGERAELGSLAALLDCDRVRLYRTGAAGGSALLRAVVLWLSRNRAVALGNHVFLPDHCCGDLPVLAHELTHCSQYQSWGPLRYFSRGLANQVRDQLHRKLRIGSSPYRYTTEPGKPFHAYGMEQQGQIVEDCFRGHPHARNISPIQPGRPKPRDQASPSA
jgi:hypothetical protein